ncbi:hypothetical protein SDC9_185466 [bioreactor metagenome]|uniref:Uncharacterized protein n=1 Tax=bioreactor metagenome TaxID=1076179 RepID=A0A645HFY3_9ZZZZ
MVTIFAVVEQREAEAIVAKVDPFLSHHFKLSKIPKGIVMCCSLNVTKLNVKGCFCRIDIYLVFKLEKRIALFPVDIQSNVNSIIGGIGNNVFVDGRFSEFSNNFVNRTNRAVFNQFSTLNIVNKPEFFIKVSFDVPGFMIEWSVIIGDKLIYNLTFGCDFSAGCLMDEARHVHVLIKLDREEIIFKGF